MKQIKTFSELQMKRAEVARQITRSKMAIRLHVHNNSFSLNLLSHLISGKGQDLFGSFFPQSTHQLIKSTLKHNLKSIIPLGLSMLIIAYSRRKMMKLIQKLISKFITKSPLFNGDQKR